MRLSHADARRQAQPDLREVQGPGIHNRVFELWRFRMGRTLSKVVLNVQGAGLQPANYRNTFITLTCSAFIMGTSITTILYIGLKNHRHIANDIVLVLNLAGAVIGLIFAVREGRRIRKVRDELRKEAPQMLAQMRADFTERYPDDPEFVNAIIHEMEESLKL
jgi:hypothetical protein